MSLLMIPGPIELSPAVKAAAAAPPRSHTSPELIAAFGRCLAAMRAIWKAPADASPYLVAGSGTLAMDAAVWNLVDPGEPVTIVQTGYFSDRMAQMAARRGAAVERVEAPPGGTVAPAALDAALARRPAKVVFVTHVDTSTGVRADASGLARVASARGALVVVDGVCATAAEPLDLQADGVDLYLTASQKALGAPPGLACWVASARAEAARDALRSPIPMFLDWRCWSPIERAYAEGRPSYFATPATSLVAALDAALAELVAEGVDASWARHARVAAAMRAAWEALGLRLVPDPADAANTLSAIRYPDGVDASLVGRIGARGVSVAGGLHPAIKDQYFRVGHMGFVTTRPELLATTVRAIGDALVDAGHRCDPAAAVAALQVSL